MDDQRPAAPSTCGDQMRVQAAASAACADVTDVLELLDSIAETGLDVSEFRAQVQRSARYAQQISSVQAAQALAYDEFIAAGGRANVNAQAAYEHATHRNTALLPHDDLTDWTPPAPPHIEMADDPDTAG